MTTQLELSAYVPAKERGATSEAAAKKTAPRAAVLRERVLAVMRRKGPMTTDECAEAMNENILSIRPRFSELLRAGQIEKTNQTRRNDSGHSARVWRVKP